MKSSFSATKSDRKSSPFMEHLTCLKNKMFQKMHKHVWKQIRNNVKCNGKIVQRMKTQK